MTPKLEQMDNKKQNICNISKYRPVRYLIKYKWENTVENFADTLKPYDPSEHHQQ